jgi:hypothetical protein
MKTSIVGNPPRYPTRSSHRRAGRSETIISSSGGGRWEQDHSSGTSPDGLPRATHYPTATSNSCWPNGARGRPRDRLSLGAAVPPLFLDAARPCRHAPGDRWFVDETYVKVAGRWVYLYRAIDQYGQVIDVLMSTKRDLAATRRFFTRALEHGPRPSEVTTDRAPAYRQVIDELLPAHAMSPSSTRTTPSKQTTDD